MKTKETKWSHLPNAHHIDWVLASFKKTPKLWDAAWHASGATAMDAAWYAAWAAARDAAGDAARDAAWTAAYGAAWAAAYNAVRDDTVWDMARGVIAALVSYDDCDQFLSMGYEKLKVWAVLSEDSRAILLLPMVYVKEELANLNLQPA